MLNTDNLLKIRMHSYTPSFEAVQRRFQFRTNYSISNNGPRNSLTFRCRISALYTMKSGQEFLLE